MLSDYDASFLEDEERWLEEALAAVQTGLEAMDQFFAADLTSA